MRVITILEDLKEFNHVKLIIALLDSAHFTRDKEGLRTAREIEKECLGKGPGDTIELRDSAWEKLRDAAETPQFPGGGTFNPKTRHCIELLDAIAEAEKVID